MKEYIVTEHPDFPYEEPKPQELIRCKDCKYYLADPWGYGNCNQMTFNDRRVRDADYCSWAERKEE